MKKVIYYNNAFFFYEDGTFRRRHWKDGEYSKWRILDGKVIYRHQDGADWMWWAYDSKTPGDLIKALDSIVEDALLGKS